MAQHKSRIVTFNVNGLRAILKRLYGGSASVQPISRFLEDIGRDADIVCLQETKLRQVELAASRELALAEGWDAIFSCASSARGYSGTATFCRTARALPLAGQQGFTSGAPPPSGGRCVQLHPDLEGCLTGEEAQARAHTVLQCHTWWVPAILTSCHGADAEPGQRGPGGGH